MTEQDTIEKPVTAPSALRITGMSKVYPGTRALDEVDLDIRQGEVHALVGGNGCGKSTLIKILCGVVPAEEGSIEVGGASIDVADIRPRDIHDLGIRVVHQDLAVFPDLKVSENMMLGADFPTLFPTKVDWKAVKRYTEGLIDRFEIDAKPNDRVRDLPVAVRAQIAIARALQDVKEGDHAVVVLDEPTASLPVHEAKILHGVMRRLAAAGHSVLLVSHRLDEVLSQTDRVTVLRDGKLVGTHDTAELTEQVLIEAILGRAAGLIRHGEAAGSSEVLVEVEGLTGGPLRDVDLTVHRGEILGLAGLLGSGRTELLRALYGDLRRSSGTVSIGGALVHFPSKERAIAAGVVLIPEDRAESGIFPGLSVDENIDVSVLSNFWKGRFRRKAMRHEVAELRQQFRVKAPTGKTLIGALSGGNQQKAVFARWLRRKPQLLLLDEPTQGVDVGARADIYAAVRTVTDDGGAAILVASDLEEMAQVVDRALIIRNGRIVGEITGDDLNAQHLNEAVYAVESAERA